MAVNALELRPRRAVALFDAAIRVCATSTGVWALTLPAGALLVAALFNLAEAVRAHQSLLGPVALWTFAWAVRAVSQGAACAYLEQQLLGTTEPSARGSLQKALARAPGLITASMTMAVLNSAILLLTGGVGFLFLGAQAAGYAAVMRGEGSALNVYGTAAKLLGPARSTATWVRLCGLTQVLLGLNLHLAAALVLYLARSVLGLDVTFVERFASLTNPLWVVTVAVVTFAIFEPLRAATGTLLLIDGRVRQEGLDLLAAAEQLPRRARKGTPLVGVALVLALIAGPARAADTLLERLEHVRSACQMKTVAVGDVRAVRALREEDQAALSRFVSRVESAAYDDEDCEGAEADLREGLAWLSPAQEDAPASDPRALARQTLARPEFQQPVAAATDAEPPEDDKAPGPFASWWKKLWEHFLEWLEQLLEKKADPEHVPPPESVPSPMLGANVVMIVAIAVVLGTLGYVLVRGRRKAETDAVDESGAFTQQALEHDPASALSRPAESWAGLADELAAKGDFREAIRHLYLALLARLHRDGAIDYDPTFSNWEYLRAYQGQEEHRGAFRELTRRFDFAWYGNLEVSAAAWGTFRRVARPLLETEQPEAASA